MEFETVSILAGCFLKYRITHKYTQQMYNNNQTTIKKNIMKNIHILPTDKRSRLANKDSNNKLELSEENTFSVNGFGFTSQNK